LDLTPAQLQEVAELERRAAQFPGGVSPIAEEWTPGDLEQASRLKRAADLTADALAFYRSFGMLTADEALAEADQSRTGIFVTTGGVEKLAREVFVGTGLNGEQALSCAFAYLVGHEYGHFIVDVALAARDLELPDADDQTGADAHRQLHHGASCPQEEAFCEAYALQFLETAIQHMPDLDTEATSLAIAAAHAHIDDGPPGYRDGAGARTGREIFALLGTVLDHVVDENPDRLALLADPDRRSARPADVPLHLVITPASAYTKNKWRVAFSR
jgi:hypothetical protein